MSILVEKMADFVVFKRVVFSATILKKTIQEKQRYEAEIRHEQGQDKSKTCCEFR